MEVIVLMRIDDVVSSYLRLAGMKIVNLLDISATRD